MPTPNDVPGRSARADGTNAVRPYRLRRAIHNHPGSALFILLVLLKLAALGLDAQPRFFLGDSGIYVNAALTGTMPPGRSFIYAWMLEAIATGPGTLNMLLLAQGLCGVLIAMLAWATLRVGFALDARLAAAVAVLIALGSEQLFYERMVMAECWGLLGLAAMFCASILHVRDGRWRWLPLIAFGGIVAVAFRTNFVPLALAFGILPVLVRGFVAEPGRPIRWLHAVAGLLALLAGTLALHAAYRTLPVQGTDARPDYIRHAGYFRLGLVAPYVEARDLAGLGLPSDFLDHLRPGLRDPRERENQVWRNNGLIPSLRASLGDVEGNRAARKIASRIFKRDRLVLLRLAPTTLVDYFVPEIASARMHDDLGQLRFDDGIRGWLGATFGLDPDDIPARASPVFDYFAASATWLTACLFASAPLALVMLALAWPTFLRAPALLLALATLGLFASHALFSPIVSFRYLHAFPWLFWVDCGALLAALAVRRASR